MLIKTLFQKRYFKAEMLLFTKNCFRKAFVQHVTVWFIVQIWAINHAKITDEKNILFHGEDKTFKRERKANTE